MSVAEKSPTNRRLLLGSVFLVANALIWYFSAAKVLESVINNVTTNYVQSLLLWTLHFGTIMISLLVGTIIVKKIERKTFLIFWTIIGVISPLSLLVIQFASVPVTFLISFLLGVSLGLGMPSCMEIFTMSIETKKRGLYGGLIMLLSGLGVVMIALFDVGQIEIIAFVLVIWRLFGLIVLICLKLPKENILIKNGVSFGSIVKQRSFILYLIPWLMFSLVNYLSIPIQNSVLPESTLNILTIVESAIIGISAIMSGFVLDIFGRKRVTMIGFILLGIGYAVLGLSPNVMASWYLWTVLDGVAWGVFYVVFVVVIWGDLSNNEKSSKYYAIGVLPFFISKYLQLELGSYLAVGISPYALFSFIAFFLFLAVLPLVYAPETLPEKVMKDRDLKSYIEKAQKAASKDSDKQKKKPKGEQEAVKSKDEHEQDSQEYEEARKLAEKYY